MVNNSESFLKDLFLGFYESKTEEEVDLFIQKHADLFKDENWFPLGGDVKMFGIVRNQQSSPIAALVEKVTNSIDALLMRKCFESGVDPQSPYAPRHPATRIQEQGWKWWCRSVLLTSDLRSQTSALRPLISDLRNQSS
jgi:hypothetical protein